MVTTSGTQPEILCYEALINYGLMPNIDFEFQSSIFGGRQQRGGQVIDFLFFNPPNLAFSILGEYFHYELSGGSRAADIINSNELSMVGITLIHIDEGDLIEDAKSVVGDALQFKDRSKLIRGL